MFVSIFVKNICFFINLVLFAFLKNNYDCFASCAKEQDDAAGDVHVLSRMWPLIVVILFEIISLVTHNNGRGKSLMDAALIIETTLFSFYVLILMAIDYGCRVIDNDQPFCKKSEYCVNSNYVIGIFTIVLYLRPLRKVVAILSRRLRSWAPDEYADDIQRAEPRQTEESSSTNTILGSEEQPGTSCDADPDREESTPEPDDQPGISREDLNLRFPVKPTAD